MSHVVDQTSLPITVSHGEGCYLYDSAGKKYLDFIAGWCVGSIGWGHAEIRAALEQEAKRATYIPPFLINAGWDRLASQLVESAPGGNFQKVFPCVSGSEAVDMAIKCARAATGKDTILSIDNVYHGQTYGAASVGDAHMRLTGSWLSHCEYLPMPGRDAPAKDVLAALEKRLAKGDVAAFISEPVWTNAGAYVPPKDFYPRVQKLCNDHETLFIMDEVATGFGHCGTLFASELWGLSPDIMPIGKAFTGGYASMAATLVSQDVYERSKGIPSYSTFAWLPTDLAATQANVNVILRQQLWKNAKTVGAHLLTLLEPLKQLPIVKDVRGMGLVLGIQLQGEGIQSKAQHACADEGLIIEIAWDTLLLTPALVLAKDEAEEGAAILRKVLEKLS